MNEQHSENITEKQQTDNPPKKQSENRFLQFLKSHIYIVLCGINLIMIDQIFRYCNQTESIAEFISAPAHLFSLAWTLIFLAIIIILPGKIKKASIIILSSFYLILMIIHCGMFSFNGSFMSFSDIMFADDGAEFFHLDYISIPPMIIITIILSLTLSIVSAKLAPLRQNCKKHIPVIVAAAVFICGVLTIQIIEKKWFNEYVTISWDSYSQYSDIYQSFNDPVSSMALSGLYQYTFRDFWLTSNIDRILGGQGKIVDEITEYYSSSEETPDNEMTGILKDKNLILIQLEAIDTWMITPEAMPNLYKIQTNSIQFTNHFAPSYLTGGTFNTEIIVNTGHMPPVYGGKTSVYTDNYFPTSLANLLNEEGYTSRSFHISPGKVYARGEVHPNWGYERYYGGLEMGMVNIEFDSEMISGYPQMVENDPFFTFIITYSGHGPYENSNISNAHYDKFAPNHPNEDPAYIHAMAHAYETDLFIGELVNRLKADGRMEDTVLVFYTDHYNYYARNDEMIMELKDTEDINFIKTVPFFIYSESISGQEIEKVTSSIDILPTIINLFDINTNSRFYAGHDAFSDAGGYVIFEDYSWYDGTNYYISGTNTSDPFIIKRNQEILDRVYHSNNVLLTDYYSHVDPSIYR